MVLKVTGQRRCRGYWPDVLTTRRASTRSSPTSRKNWPSWTRASTVTTKRCMTSCRTASPANTSTNETSPAGSVLHPPWVGLYKYGSEALALIGPYFLSLLLSAVLRCFLWVSCTALNKIRSLYSQECKDPRRQYFCDSWPRPLTFWSQNK